MSSKYLPRTLSLAQKMDALSIPEPNSGCYLWLSSLVPGGYGTLSYQGTPYYSHHAAWMAAKGSIPTGRWVLHKCDMRCCVNPDHLYLGDAQDNSDDRMNRGRHVKAMGERSGKSKLTDEDIINIRADTRSQRAIAADYGVSHTNIGHVKRGETWPHIPQGA